MRPGLKISVIVIVLFSSVIMTSAPAIKKTVKHEVIEKKVGDIALVYIPAGSFKMGRDVKGKDYSPVRTVKITKGFWIGKYEITQKQYSDLKGSNPCADSRYGEGDSLPLFNVSWYNAVEFCNTLSVNHGLKPYYNISGIGTDDDNISTHDDIKREVTVNKGADGFRLPTEAEWEYACMGSKLSDFYWGNSQTWDGAGAYAWHMFNAGQKSYSKGRFWWVKYHKVKKPGQKKPNIFGVYDISGNVAEWCFDRYTSSYSSAGKEDPDGGNGEFRYRVVRGGSILDSPKDLAGFKRWPVEPFEKTGTHGIRVVLPE